MNDTTKTGCPACAKSTERTDEGKKKLINRLSRIEGQIRALKSMVESDSYCIDILTQSSAAGAALGAFNRELLKSHLSGCVVRDIKEGKEDTIEELMDVLEKLVK